MGTMPGGGLAVCGFAYQDNAPNNAKTFAYVYRMKPGYEQPIHVTSMDEWRQMGCDQPVSRRSIYWIPDYPTK